MAVNFKYNLNARGETADASISSNTLMAKEENAEFEFRSSMIGF